MAPFFQKRVGNWILSVASSHPVQDCLTVCLHLAVTAAHESMMFLMRQGTRSSRWSVGDAWLAAIPSMPPGPPADSGQDAALVCHVYIHISCSVVFRHPWRWFANQPFERISTQSQIQRFISRKANNNYWYRYSETSQSPVRRKLNNLYTLAIARRPGIH
jgi:hypothetical protein